MARIILCLLGIALCLQAIILLPKPRRRKKNPLYDRYRIHRLYGRLVSIKGKQRLLESYGWYRNICGGWAHPHGMDYLDTREIRRCTKPQLAYKLEHGSLAPLPPELTKGKETKHARHIRN